MSNSFLHEQSSPHAREEERKRVGRIFIPPSIKQRKNGVTFCTGTLFLFQTFTLINKSQLEGIENEMPFLLGLPNQASPVTIQENVNTTQYCTVVTPCSFQIHY